MAQKLKLKREEILVFEALKNKNNSVYRLIYSLAKQNLEVLQEKDKPSK